MAPFLLLDCFLIPLVPHVVSLLAEDKPLPERNCDHGLVWGRRTLARPCRAKLGCLPLVLGSCPQQKRGALAGRQECPSPQKPMRWEETKSVTCVTSET